MNNRTSATRTILILLAIVIVINGFSFFVLPDRVSLQINTNWDVHGSQVHKIVFLLMAPLVLIGAWLAARNSVIAEKQALLLSGIAFLGSIATIVFNLMGT